MFEKSIFSERLKSLRRTKGVSQTILAELLGVTKTQISDLENGKTTTSIERFYALADYFNVSLDYLVGRSDDPAFAYNDVANLQVGCYNTFDSGGIHEHKESFKIETT